MWYGLPLPPNLRQLLRYSLRFLLNNKVLNYKEFRNFLGTRLFLLLSLNMQITIVAYMAYQLTKDPLTLGMIGLWEVIPAIGFSLFSGHFVDQREKRNLLLWCIVGFTLLSVFYFGLSLPSSKEMLGTKYTVWLIYFGVFTGGAIRAFASPSNFALLGLIIPKRLYANATTWSSSAWQLGAVIGPLVGGLLIGRIGFTKSLAAVFVFKMIALIFVSRIGRKPIMKKTKEPVLKSLKEGLNFVFSTQIILAALALDMFAVLFGGAIALLPVYADEILQVGEVGYGWLRAAQGIGAIVTLGILSFIPLKTNAGKKLLICVAGFGVTTIIFGLSNIFLLSFGMLMLGGMFDAVSVVIRGTILQLYTPDDMRGRVAAVSTMFISSSNELGAAESGFTAKLMGTVAAVVFGGCMTLVVVVTTFFKAPKLRKLRLDGK